MILTSDTTRLRGPRIITYRDYNKFNNSVFRAKLLEKLTSNSDGNQDFANVNRISKKVLDKHAPCKKKYVRANDGPFMTKELRKAIMKRTRLKNRFNKNKTNENWTAFQTQRNFCVKLLRQNKRSYYNRLDPKVVSDSK